MQQHSYQFINHYNGSGAFGWDRKTDEETLKYYLQKFADDTHMDLIVPKMTSEEMTALYTLINEILRNHLSENEYHHTFLKDGSHGHE